MESKILIFKLVVYDIFTLIATIKLLIIVISCSDWMHLARIMLQSLDVTISAKKSSFQWITSFVRFIGELHTALFAYVAIDVEIFVHRNNTNGFFCSLYRSYT